jgi:hypothetical protein
VVARFCHGTMFRSAFGAAFPRPFLPDRAYQPVIFCLGSLASLPADEYFYTAQTCIQQLNQTPPHPATSTKRKHKGSRRCIPVFRVTALSLAALLFCLLQRKHVHLAGYPQIVEAEPYKRYSMIPVSV